MQNAWKHTVIVFLAVLHGVARLSAGDVTVEKKAALVERKAFDPAHPPADMPPLKSGEAALTQSTFECSVALSYQISNRVQVAGRCRESLKIKSVAVTLQLKVIIWLPQGASAKLSDHEEGHRKIAERIYQDADRAAREAAQILDGKTMSAEGEDCQTAEKQATQSAANGFCRQYLEQTGKRAAHIGDIYDELTAHGTRAEPAEDEAIRQAFAKHEPGASTSTTQPAK